MPYERKKEEDISHLHVVIDAAGMRFDVEVGDGEGDDLGGDDLDGPDAILVVVVVVGVVGRDDDTRVVGQGTSTSRVN